MSNFKLRIRVKLIIMEWPSYYMHEPHRACVLILGSKTLTLFEVV